MRRACRTTRTAWRDRTDAPSLHDLIRAEYTPLPGTLNDWTTLDVTPRLRAGIRPDPMLWPFWGMLTVPLTLVFGLLVHHALLDLVLGMLMAALIMGLIDAMSGFEISQWYSREQAHAARRTTQGTLDRFAAPQEEPGSAQASDLPGTPPPTAQLPQQF